MPQLGFWHSMCTPGAQILTEAGASSGPNPTTYAQPLFLERASEFVGTNSICTLGENNRPNCGCPNRYTLVDPSDEPGNCALNFTLSSCLEDEDKRNHGSAEDIYAFVELKNTGFPPATASYALLAPFSEDECRNSCLHDCIETLVETNLRCFTYQELFKATDGFKEELGRGAFGIVYKGFIPSDVAVAVKKLTNLFQDKEKEFRTEVNVISQTHHKNLVRLLGFCDEGQERLLVYELHNGTLSSLLFTGESRPSWNQRCQIASAIARGLLYLHEDCAMQIIHCNIKPQNILLDEYYNVRISDFGLAKLLKMDQSYTHKHQRNKRELFGGRNGGERERELLTDWAYDYFMDGKLDAFVEGDIEALSEKEKLKNLAMVAFWCIQEDPSLRPTMKKVTQMLDGAVEVPVPPCPFDFNGCTTVITQ
ncbi:G-type lectin S-receptor-like serine/threonine-protein kinase RLK1 [Eucalyptus grandis]|uniref:G-type lectin S-receptor-like serine/threonine-protein kinase RLK1 n=1 Tax=Eucalyptus grandis TaxID=71139 RepID=UPI00192EC67E|nr:G-type lectin S-receptor-like serine/threonine-protein kinase RLK1 [Eucalyptus grandis]